MYTLYKKPKESDKRKDFGEHTYVLQNEVWSKREAEKIKKTIKMSDPRIKVRIIKRKWDLRSVYSIYAYGEI
jgi:hypothetical protein